MYWCIEKTTYAIYRSKFDTLSIRGVIWDIDVAIMVDFAHLVAFAAPFNTHFKAQFYPYLTLNEAVWDVGDQRGYFNYLNEL